MGLPAFQLPMFAKCDSLPKRDLWGTCLFSGIHSRRSFLEFESSNPKRSLRFLRAAVRSTISTLRYGCIMPIPSLQLQKKVEKACLMQRSRGFGWKWGCQPFSCRCSQNVTQWQTRFGRHICLRPRHPFPPFLFGKYI